MTLGDMEKRVRFIVGDSNEPYRFEAGFVITSLCEGIERLRGLRPESRYFGLRLFNWVRPSALKIEGMTDAETITVRAFEPYFDPKWNDAVANFSASRCYEYDQSDTLNTQLAADHMAKFEKLAMS